MMFAPEQAEMMGWEWRKGYQSHFITSDGVLIPTCNIEINTDTRAGMMRAYYRQIEIDLRFKAAHIEFKLTGKLVPQSQWESIWLY